MDIIKTLLADSSMSLYLSQGKNLTMRQRKAFVSEGQETLIQARKLLNNLTDKA